MVITCRKGTGGFAIGASVLNRMLELGRQEYVRLA
jgi:hypothetical protein